MQQSIQDYISQIEEEVLGRTRDDSSRTLPIIERNHVHGPKHPDLAGDSLRDGALSTTSHHSRTHAQTLEENEEQKFISSFWRPNRYPV